MAENEKHKNNEYIPKGYSNCSEGCRSERTLMYCKRSRSQIIVDDGMLQITGDCILDPFIKHQLYKVSCLVQFH